MLYTGSMKLEMRAMVFSTSWKTSCQKASLLDFRGASALDYLLHLGEGCEQAVSLVPALRKVNGVNYVQELDPLHSGAIEHLALIDLEPKLD